MFTNLAAAKLIDLIYQTIEEFTIVAHDDGCSIESLNGFFQHILRLHVEVVGRLIENEEIHRFEQELDHSQSATLASTQYLDKLL